MKHIAARMPAIVVAGIAALTIASCGESTPTGGAHGGPSHTASPSHTGNHNRADVTFVRMMIPHHRQAVAMAKLAPSRTAAPQVKQLARNIIDSQTREIDLMTRWLNKWGKPVPTSGSMNHAGHAMSGAKTGDHGDMSGMMSPTDMRPLKKLFGDKFDRAFLRMMIPHHKNAIQTAQQELNTGEYAPAKDLARQIIKSQSAEIDHMRQLLDKKPKPPTG